MRGTLADALRQATKSSLLSKPSNKTGSKLSKQLATTCQAQCFRTAQHSTAAQCTIVQGSSGVKSLKWVGHDV